MPHVDARVANNCKHLLASVVRNILEMQLTNLIVVSIPLKVQRVRAAVLAARVAATDVAAAIGGAHEGAATAATLLFGRERVVTKTAAYGL